MSVRASLLVVLAPAALGLVAPAASAPAQAARTEQQPPAASTAVSVQATADKSEITVGEPFTVEVKATGPAGATYTFPAEASTDSFDLRSVAAPAAAPVSGSVATPPAEPGVHRYDAMVFALGDVEIPPIPVRYRLPDGSEGEASSAPLELKVGSLLPKDPDQRKLADVRGPVDASIGRAFWIALAATLLLLAAVGHWLLRRRRRSAAVVAPPVTELAADAEALRALDALAARDLPSSGEFRVFYIELAFVAKRYLERRLQAPVVEMTSAETLAFLREHAHGGELLPVVRDLAGAADRIKFANADGLAEEARRHLASVRGLVTALEQRLRPAAAEGEGRAA